MKKIFISGIALLFILPSIAQVTKARLQASGLTCAMCAKSVYKNLESLSFVDKIDTDLEKSAFLISFKPGASVDADQIRKKVEDAGFSVAGLSLTAQFNGQELKNDQHVTIGGQVFHFVGISSQVVDGEKQFNLVDKGFLTPKDAKKYTNATSMDCYRTGTAGSCCSKEGIDAKTRIYHVTI
jgi:copper chaperone CopZ